MEESATNPIETGEPSSKPRKPRKTKKAKKRKAPSKGAPANKKFRPNRPYPAGFIRGGSAAGRGNPSIRFRPASAKAHAAQAP